MVELGRLQPVKPRDVWPHEALDFTPWLLANVDVLSDLLGMDLVLEAAEHPVGNFSLDLIGQDQSTGERVIVENQLELSDHTHLGQIITYAAGTDPTTIVWVTAGFRPEHRAAIDWLNQRTDENTRVFGVVIHLVQIGDSPIAPNFELVAQPNDWEKVVRRTAAGSGDPGEQALLYEEFWSGFSALARERGARWIGSRSSTRGSSFDTRTEIGGQIVSLWFQRDGLTVQLYWNDPDPAVNLARFEALERRRDEFEALVGGNPVWDDMPGRKATRVTFNAGLGHVTDRSQWPAMHEWMIERQTRIRAALDQMGANRWLREAGEL